MLKNLYNIVLKYLIKLYSEIHFDKYKTGAWCCSVVGTCVTQQTVTPLHHKKLMVIVKKAQRPIEKIFYVSKFK